MTTTRTLVETTATYRVYEIRSGTTVVGRDVETIPAPVGPGQFDLTISHSAACSRATTRSNR